MTPIIFLDFDGVLNSNKTIIRGMEDAAFEWRRLAHWIEPDLMALVSGLAVETSADIVICSSWRERYGAVKLRAVLRTRGLPREVSVDACRVGGKGDAIREYLQHCPADRFVILDDCPDGVMGTALQRHLVAPHGFDGVTAEEIERARRLLTDAL